MLSCRFLEVPPFNFYAGTNQNAVSGCTILAYRTRKFYDSEELGGNV